MLSVSSLPTGSVVVVTVSGQDSLRRRTLGLTKGTQHQNPTVHINVKVVSWVTKYNQQAFQSYVLPHTVLITCSSADIFFSWLDNTSGPRPPGFRGFLITIGRTPLDGLSACRRSVPNNTQDWQQTDVQATGGIRTHNPTDAIGRVANVVGLLAFSGQNTNTIQKMRAQYAWRT